MHRRLIQLAQIAQVPLLIGVAGGLLAGACSVVQAYTLGTIVERVFLERADLAGVGLWLRWLLGVIVVRGLLLWMQEAAASEVAIRVKQELRARLFTQMLRLGPEFSGGQKTGELATAAVDGIEALDAYYGQYLPQLAISALVPATILMLVFPLDPLSGAILLLTAPLIPFFMYMIGRTAEQATSRQYATLGRLSSHLLDSIQGLATLKIFGQSAAQTANIGRVADKFREVTLRVLQVSFLSAFSLELIATISTAIIAVEVGLRLLYGHLGFGEALFLLILAPEFYMPLRMLGARFHAGQAGIAAARRIFEVLDTKPIARPGNQAETVPDGNGRIRSTVPRAIHFEKVSFTYPGRDRPALDNVDLLIAPGAHIAIAGASGAGKSTMAALLLGFMQPTTGELWMGDRTGGEAAPCRAGAEVGWVPQRPHLFHDTIAANIRLGKPQATDEEIWTAVRLAHLDELIESLPEGLETVIGESGARLSSGEAQRLALARAFLLDAPILVLDEPSSSLDPESEALLEDSLQRLGAGRTLVTIAHRLNTIKRADQIVLLDAGRIIERGTHAELAALGGSYSRLLGVDSPSSDEDRHLDPVGHALPAALPSALGAVEDSMLKSQVSKPMAPEQTTVRSLLGFLQGSWGGVAASVLFGTLSIGSSVALMGTSAWLISAAALQPGIAALQVAIVCVRLFGISRAVFRYFERLASHRVTFRLLRNLRVWFYQSLEPLAPARLMDYHAGDLVNRAVADVETLENLYVRLLAPVLTAFLVGAGVSAFLWWQGAPELAAALAIAFGMAGFVIPLWSMLRAKKPGEKLIALRTHLRIQLVDCIQGLPDIVAFGRAHARSEAIRQIGAEHAKAQRSMARISGAQAGLWSVAVNGAMWISIVLWIRRVTAGDGSGLFLAPFALLILASFEGVAGLPQAAQLWPSTAAAARRLFEIVRVAPGLEVRQHTAPAMVAARPSALPIPELEFQCVRFTYPGRSRPTLRDISFSIERGESIALVGPSGAGKSTVAQLILRFWEYGSGEILLRGESIRGTEPDTVRAEIGYTSQHPYVFDTSILENLRLARRGATLADLESAARRASMHEFIRALPDGYATLVGEHGARLSAGERQRLGIARLILKEAPLLILDEPTANLDTVNEGQVLEDLFELARGRTCLWITHRLRRMERFAQILVMDHGAIRERGTHETLMGARDLYARLWHLQNGGDEVMASRLANGN